MDVELTLSQTVAAAGAGGWPDSTAQALERARTKAAASHPQSALPAMSFEPEV